MNQRLFRGSSSAAAKWQGYSASRHCAFLCSWQKHAAAGLLGAFKSVSFIGGEELLSNEQVEQEIQWNSQSAQTKTEHIYIYIVDSTCCCLDDSSELMSEGHSLGSHFVVKCSQANAGDRIASPK